MTRRPITAAATLLLGLLSIAAGPPVALRVELEPAGRVGEDTAVSVTVQVAPEDRQRVGRDVWIQTELLQGGVQVDRLARALDLDDRGQARFETAWPAGDYELRVEITGPERGARGAWVGRVTVPEVERDGTVSEPEPPTAPASELPVEDAAIAAAAAADTEPGVAPTGEPMAATAEPQPAPEAADETSDLAVDEPGDSAGDGSDALAAAAAAAAGVAAVTAAPPAEPGPTDSAPPDEIPAAAPPSEQPVPGTAAPAADEPVPAAGGGVVEAPPEPQPPVAVAVAAPSTTAAAASWAQRSGATTDVTVVVTAQNRPILGLGPSAFELRVGRTDVALDTVGDASSAPLNLGIVVHLGGGSVELASDIAQQLGAFSLRTRSGGDLLLVTPGRAVPEWGSTADDIARTVGAAGESGAVDFAGLVAGALEAFEGHRGRSFLLVVSDGAGESSKSSWKDTVAVAENAGVAVYVVGVRDSGFDNRARSSLTKIAAISGGRSYFLGDAGMTTMTLDYVGELVDASYALPFRAPEGPAEIKVEVANRGWHVAHPRRAP